MSRTKKQRLDLSDRILNAFMHPVRVQMLEILLHDSVSATGFSQKLDISIFSASYHLCKVLDARLDLLDVVERHQRRGSEERVFALKRDYYELVVRLLIALGSESTEIKKLYCYRCLTVDASERHEIDKALHEFSSLLDAVATRGATNSSTRSNRRGLVVGAAVFDAAP